MAIDDETPLRLADAVALAFPNGGIGVPGLRKEIARGRLEVELIAGKQFVTLRGIREMREMCRIPAKEVVVRPVWRSPVHAPEPIRLSPKEALTIRLQKHKRDLKAAQKLERQKALNGREELLSQKEKSRGTT